MITTDKKIKICDDTGSGDDLFVVDILYENNKLILCIVDDYEYESYDGSFSPIE